MTSRLPPGRAGIDPSPSRQVDGTLPALGIHVTYWQQILFLIEFEAEMEQWERGPGPQWIGWARVELRDDE